MTSSRPTILLLVFTIAALMPQARSAPAPEAAVDLTPAITIGGFVTSRYLFDKAYRQFDDGRRGRNGPPPGEASLETWFHHYIAQLLIKAAAQKEDYVNRREVIDITARMARYMLTQPRGPLYRALGAAEDVELRRARRARILSTSEFTLSSENLARLWTAILPAFQRRTLPRQEDIAAIKGAIVATYVFEGTKRRITTADFVRDFRDGIARVAPRDAKLLGEQVADLVVAEYDFAEAERRGLDQTPQFSEDRRNFALNQALALYEKEVLAPRVTITPQELRAAYQADLARYSVPATVSGSLLVYADLESAREALMRTPAGAATQPVKSLDDFVVHRNDGRALGGVPYELLVSVPVGRSIGPFPWAGAFAVFVKRGVGELEPRSFSAVESEIRARIERERIDALELENLARNLNRVKILIDLAPYGLKPLSPRELPQSPPSVPVAPP